MLLQKLVGLLTPFFKQQAGSLNSNGPTKKTDQFDLALSRILKFEGGYVNNPHDPGGETNYGITKQVAFNYGYKGSMKTIPMATVSNIYRQFYWDCVGANHMPFSVAMQVFDAAVQHGPARAIGWLHQCTASSDNAGQVGSPTIQKILQGDKAGIITNYLAKRSKFYAKLPTYPIFGKGWDRRIEQMRKYATEDLLAEAR